MTTTRISFEASCCVKLYRIPFRYIALSGNSSSGSAGGSCPPLSFLYPLYPTIHIPPTSLPPPREVVWLGILTLRRVLSCRYPRQGRICLLNRCDGRSKMKHLSHWRVCTQVFKFRTVKWKDRCLTRVLYDGR